jgi:signal peptide peptidase SppA
MTTRETISGEAWAICPETLALLCLPDFAPSMASHIDRRFARVSTYAAQRHFSNGSIISVIPVFGLITNRESLRQQIFGGTSVDKLKAQFRSALGDPSVSAIVLNVDSPGGEVTGTLELADEIFQSRGTKKIVAVANCSALSAAFWLASAASELVVTPSGEVGSVGIYAVHDDYSGALEKAGIRVTFIKAGKFKTDGNPSEPLADSARSDMQQKVDAFYEKFVGAVARGRRTQKSTVRERFGNGRGVLARDAVALGMADRVATFDETVSRLTSVREDGERTGSLAIERDRLALRRRRLALLGSSSDPSDWREALDRLRLQHA